MSWKAHTSPAPPTVTTAPSAAFGPTRSTSATLSRASTLSATSQLTRQISIADLSESSDTASVRSVKTLGVGSGRMKPRQSSITSVAPVNGSDERDSRAARNEDDAGQKTVRARSIAAKRQRVDSSEQELKGKKSWLGGGWSNNRDRSTSDSLILSTPSVSTSASASSASLTAAAQVKAVERPSFLRVPTNDSASSDPPPPPPAAFVPPPAAPSIPVPPVTDTMNSSASYRGWLSTLTLSRSASTFTPSLSGMSIDDKASSIAPASSTYTESVISSIDQSAGEEVALPISPVDSVIHQPPAPGHMWWNPFAVAVPTVTSFTSPLAAPAPTPLPPVSELVAEVAPTLVSDSIPPPTQPKTWMETIWGEADGGKGTAAGLTPSSASTVSTTSTDDVPSAPFSTIGSSVPPIIANSYHTLRNRASWAMFSSASTVASSDASTSNPIAIDRGRNITPRPVSILSKSPHGNLNLASSASSRASSQSRNISAPNSPLLGPTTASPKPLTGSIPSGSRSEVDQPFENYVLPTFQDTFDRPPRSFPPKKSTITKAVSVVSSYLFSQPPATTSTLAEKKRMTIDPAEKLPKSLKVMGLPARSCKRVVTIGVHGWFPNPKLKSVFGEPTGTSIKFATMMHDAVQSFLESSSECTSFNIQAIALEGDGLVADRVDTLFTALMAREEWIEAIKRADVVFIATHSQGSVVSTHLLRKMFEIGLVTDGSKVHLLAMCAIVQGPFVYLSQSYALSPYFTYLESAAARELFEFQSPDSIVSKRFLASLQMVLDRGVKITCIGSINDQVVPLYSALFSGISHPAILRAVYIDSAAFRTSDFLVNLVVFAMRLRNSGLGDHDLVYHISEALAGALTGVGHSKIYEECDVFNLAVRYQFDTTSLTDAPTRQLVMPLLPSLPTLPSLASVPLSMSFNPTERRNPYLLTWSLRGIVEDFQVRELFAVELSALREAFEIWKPTTKVLKEVKLKLEGIRMLPRAKKEGKL